MFRSIQPFQFLLVLLAGWINRRQFDAIEYVKEENRLLKERLGGRRVQFGRQGRERRIVEVWYEPARKRHHTRPV